MGEILMIRFGISKKINFIFFLSIQFIALIIGISFYIQYSRALMEGAEKTLTNGLSSVETIINIKELNNLSHESNLTPRYKRTWKKLRKIQENFKLSYLYILIPNQKGEFIYTYETGDDPDVIATPLPDGKYSFQYAEHVPEEKRAIPPNQPAGLDTYFEVYDDAPPAVFEAFEKEKLIFQEYQDKHGSFKSAFMPLIYKGKKVGIIAADYDISYIKDLQRKAILTLVSVLLVGILISFMVRFLVQRTIINPILKLNEGSKSIASGNLDSRIQIDQRDELGELAKTFNGMAESLKESFLKIKEYNELLEEKVKIRTQELQETLDRVQQLKKQQDGDYFLTSLLLDPLMQNRNKSKNVDIKFLMDQKKKFHFKNKQYSLGGDVCITGNLYLNDERYSMFFNGDAMGKSMQGAGGALVIGSIINAIMARSSANQRKMKMSPDEWLQETFIEAQRVMETFGGTMFISCVLGLVNERTGLLHYFNAEHPFVILFRDGKAEFIDEEISAYKLGFPENALALRRFQLCPEDVIFCGSDGKDDLVVSVEDGLRTMNEDHHLILNSIERSGGSLDNLYEVLQECGEFADDLSLVKVSFSQNMEPIKSKINWNEVNQHISTMIKEKRFERALHELNRIEEDHVLKDYYTGLCLSRTGQNEKALEVLENAIQKFQNHFSSLRLLAFTYQKIGMHEEAKRYAKQALLIQPEDDKLKHLIEDIPSA